NSKMEMKEVQQYISALNKERSSLLIKIRELKESSEQKSISEDKLQNLKEQLEHLILLRDNLDAAVRSKDKTKEKMMESILDEELNHRTDEVSILEEKIKEFERKLKGIQDEFKKME
ncbi:hypothetical protein SK128_007546, partial [Halocaridina rubra]